MTKIVIIDYGLGNLRSVYKGLEHVGASPVISADAEEIASADGLVLPGVGAYRDGMKHIQPVMDDVYRAVDDGIPMLGICLGMQMLLSESEEGMLSNIIELKPDNKSDNGHIKGLDIIPGKVVRFSETLGLKVPQMGWNTLNIKSDSPFFEGISPEPFVYFVHSYHAVVEPQYSLASCEYGIEFDAIIGKDNVIGTQFHPEKSGDVGLKMLKNFMNMCI
ncbi:MAG: imidazole glycerol phosphate synthase subunit HisH [Methanosarcinales archaeon]|nr:imidazole glycerol phosphate synthase subunit HisH [Methanosarcinales archaeon]